MATSMVTKTDVRIPRTSEPTKSRSSHIVRARTTLAAAEMVMYTATKLQGRVLLRRCVSSERCAQIPDKKRQADAVARLSRVLGTVGKAHAASKAVSRQIRRP